MEDYKFDDVGDQSTAWADLNQEADGFDMPPAYSCTLNSSFGGTRLEFPVGVALEVSLWCEYTRHCLIIGSCLQLRVHVHVYVSPTMRMCLRQAFCFLTLLFCII